VIVVIASAAAETAAEIKNRNHTVRIRGSDHTNDCTNAVAIPPALSTEWVAVLVVVLVTVKRTVLDKWEWQW
jgi:hypothetical protein